jgi:hypothetical protein
MRTPQRTLSAAEIESIADAVAARLANQRPPGPDPAYARVPDAARYLGLSPRSLQNLVYSGRLPSRLLGCCRVIAWSDLRAFVRAGDHPEPINPYRGAARPDAEPEVAE